MLKRWLLHPSLPLILGILAVLAAGLLLIATALLPDLFKAEAAGEKVEEIVQQAVSVIINNEPEEAETVMSPSYVLDVRDQYLKEKKTFVEADLSAMQVKAYRDGELVVSVPIKSKGKEGSWWETPVGVYSIKSKEKNHFSSFGHVYQPWSLVFQGNFFIHGWPYYPDGTPVSSKFSGGCIRLADEDAKAVFDAVEVGTPVLVYKQPTEASPLPNFTGKPDITDPYAIADVPSGTTIRSRDAGAEVVMGKALNLLVALTAVDYINVEKEVRVNAPNSERLQAYASISVLDLLRLLLSEGDPEAARTIAAIRGDETFIKYMNAKAAAIGMGHTTVVSVDTDDVNNKTTVGDVALLARYLAENRSFVLQLTQSARGNLAYDPPAWSDLTFSQNLKALPGFFGGVEGSNGTPAVVVITLPGEEKRHVVISAGGAGALDDLARAAQWLQQ